MNALLIAATLLASPGEGYAKLEAYTDVVRARPGVPLWVAFEVSLEPSWHTYWRNPGDNGSRPEWDWKLPEGWTQGPVSYPAPRRFPDPSGTSYGYKDQVTYLVQITPPASARGKVTFKGTLQMPICKELCVPADLPFEFSLEVGGEPARDPKRGARLMRALELLPTSGRGMGRIQVQGDQLRLTVPHVPALGEGNFDLYVGEPGMVDHTSPVLSAVREGPNWVLMLRKSPTFTLQPGTLTYVLAVPAGGGRGVEWVAGVQR